MRADLVGHLVEQTALTEDIARTAGVRVDLEAKRPSAAKSPADVHLPPNSSCFLERATRANPAEKERVRKKTGGAPKVAGISVLNRPLHEPQV